MLKWVSFHIQAYWNVFLKILEYFSQSVDVDGLNLLAHSVFEQFDCAGVYFCTLCPSIGPKETVRQALDRLPLVSNFLTNFWMQHFDSARLSPNSVRNAVWHALNEPVCQYLRTRNPSCSTVYIDNSLGPLARDSPCRISTMTEVYCNCHTIDYICCVLDCNKCHCIIRTRLDGSYKFFGRSSFSHQPI